MKSWAAIEQFVYEHGLPYRVIRWNMTAGGCLEGTVSGQAVAYTVRDAARLLRQEYAHIL
jgi:hypothetical protein